MTLDVIVYGLDFFQKIFTFDYEQCYDWDRFVNSKSFRILIKRESIFYSNIDRNIKERIIEYTDLSNNCDLLLIWNEELHDYNFNTCGDKNIYSEVLRNPKIFAVTGGIINHEVFKLKSFTNLSWLEQCVRIYKDLKFKLDELNPLSPKPFTFDALLGSQRFHRDFVYKKITENNLQDRIITSYLNDITSESWYRDDDVDYSQYIENKNSYSKLMSSNPITYYDKPVWIAHVIPFGVYNKSAYTIVTETGYKNGVSFPTEKTAKPILGKRLFIIFSGQYFLRSLQEVGFKTFCDIIDESYDLIENNEQRYEKAWKCVEQLLNLPQEFVLEKVKPIVEHNFNHLMNFPFDDFVKQQCTELLVNRYNESKRIYN
jgi:hypothetical protein